MYIVINFYIFFLLFFFCLFLFFFFPFKAPGLLLPPQVWLAFCMALISIYCHNNYNNNNNYYYYNYYDSIYIIIVGFGQSEDFQTVY